MPARVYSETFLYGTGLGVTFTYTVPDGKRAVVRSILACSYEAGQGLNVKVHGRIVCVFNFPAANTTQNLDCRVVAYAGETISCYTSSSELHLHVSGYLFDNTAGGVRPLPSHVERESAAPTPVAELEAA